MKKGYTILEIVIYVSILTVIVIMVVESLLSIYRMFTVTQIERKLTLNGDVAMETMIRELRSANGIDASGSVFGAAPGALKLNTGGSTKTFALSGQILTEQDGAGPAQNLTNSDVTVASLTFYRSSGTLAEIVKIQLSLQAGSGIYAKTKNFYGSAAIRGIY